MSTKFKAKILADTDLHIQCMGVEICTEIRHKTVKKSVFEPAAFLYLETLGPKKNLANCIKAWIDQEFFASIHFIVKSYLSFTGHGPSSDAILREWPGRTNKSYSRFKKPPEWWQ